MQIIPPTVITTAATLISPSVDIKQGSMPLPLNIISAMNFTYGSGGTTINVYLQTSFDGGASWVDVVAFTQITTASNRKVANVSRMNKLAPVAITDQTLAAGSANDGIVGPLWRCVAISTGTYAGNSTLRVDIFGEH